MFLKLKQVPGETSRFCDPVKLREISVIAFPALVELVMSTLFGMVDMIMVGRLTAKGIAAIGLTNQPVMLLLAVFAAVNVGTTTLVAWKIGAQDYDDARAVTRQAILLNVILGTIISVIGIILARPIVVFMGANQDTLVLATQYLQIIAGGLVFQAVTMSITAALRGVGETRIPMFYNVGTNLLNVFGNYVLIYGKLGFPQLGVAGAAFSTSIARLIACLIALYIVFCSGKSVIALAFKSNWRINWGIVRKIFSIGLPASAEQFVLQSGLMLFAKTVSGLGTDTFAAHQIGINISGLTWSPSMAFGVTCTTLVGQSLGARNPEKAEQYASIIHKLSMLVACIMGIIFLLFAPLLARLYTSDLYVITMAVMVLRILALSQLGQSTQLTLAGALRGAGDTLYPLYASAFGIWGFRVVTAYVFVSIFHWGLVGAWAAFVLDQYARASVVYFRFRTGQWKYAKDRLASEPGNEDVYI
jgi:putative MATE family efflux protein